MFKQISTGVEKTGRLDHPVIEPSWDTSSGSRSDHVFAITQSHQSRNLIRREKWINQNHPQDLIRITQRIFQVSGSLPWNDRQGWETQPTQGCESIPPMYRIHFRDDNSPILQVCRNRHAPADQGQWFPFLHFLNSNARSDQSCKDAAIPCTRMTGCPSPSRIKFRSQKLLGVTLFIPSGKLSPV